MSHIHQNHYKDNKQLIAYINGFLWPLEILNDEVNHNKTYYVMELERIGNYEESIKNYLQDGAGVLVLKEITDWEKELAKTSTMFFENILNKVELNDRLKNIAEKYHESKRDITGFTLLNGKFISLMQELVTDNPKFYEVFGSMEDCAQTDYLVDSELGLFFIHFGISD